MRTFLHFFLHFLIFKNAGGFFLLRKSACCLIKGGCRTDSGRWSNRGRRSNRGRWSNTGSSVRWKTSSSFGQEHTQVYDEVQIAWSLHSTYIFHSGIRGHLQYSCYSSIFLKTCLKYRFCHAADFMRIPEAGLMLFQITIALVSKTILVTALWSKIEDSSCHILKVWMPILQEFSQSSK